MGLEEVERDFSQDCDVFGPMVCSVSGAVFAEYDIENPVEAVLDMPVLTNDFEQSGRGYGLGEHKDTRAGLGLLPRTGPLGGDAGDGGKLRKSVRFRHFPGPHDNRPPGLEAAMADLRTGLRLAAPFGPQPDFRVGEKLGMIGFEGQNVVGTCVHNGPGNIGAAMERIGGDDAPRKVEQGQRIEHPLNLTAPWGRALGPSSGQWPCGCLPPRH